MVGVATVEPREFAETMPVIGQLIAVTNSIVASRVPGIVQSVEIAVGDHVEKDRPLVRLDDMLLRIERDAAAASLREARAGREIAASNFDLARQSFDRMDRLKESAAFSRGQFDDLREQMERAQSEIVQAEARILNAEAALARAEYNLRHTEIRAPFSGVVVDKRAQPGQYITTGAAVLTLLDDNHLEIEVEVPTEIVGALSVGQTISARLADGATLSATVRALIPQEAATTRTRPVRFTAELVENGTPFAIGQSVTVEVPIGDSRPVLAVPKDALVQASGGWIVYIIEDGKAAPRPVQIGKAVGDRFEVLSGLDEGMDVVIRGNERLRPGQPVQAMPAAEPSGDGTPAAGSPATSDSG